MNESPRGNAINVTSLKLACRVVGSVLLIACLASIGGCQSNSSAHRPNQIVSGKEIEWFNSAQELVDASELIALGTVTQVSEGRYFDPVERGDRYRDVTLHVDRVYRSTFAFDGSEAVLHQGGWLSNGTSYAQEGHEWSDIGDQLLIFAVRDPDDGSTFLVLNRQSAYRVRTDGKLTNESEDRVLLADGVRTLAQAEQAIDGMVQLAPVESTSVILSLARDRNTAPSSVTAISTGMDEIGAWEIQAAIYPYESGETACLEVLRDRERVDAVCLQTASLAVLPKEGKSVRFVSPAVTAVVVPTGISDGAALIADTGWSVRIDE